MQMLIQQQRRNCDDRGFPGSCGRRQSRVLTDLNELVSWRCQLKKLKSNTYAAVALRAEHQLFQ